MASLPFLDFLWQHGSRVSIIFQFWTQIENQLKLCRKVLNLSVSSPLLINQEFISVSNLQTFFSYVKCMRIVHVILLLCFMMIMTLFLLLTLLQQLLIFLIHLCYQLTGACPLSLDPESDELALSISNHHGEWAICKGHWTYHSGTSVIGEVNTAVLMLTLCWHSARTSDLHGNGHPNLKILIMISAKTKLGKHFVKHLCRKYSSKYIIHSGGMSTLSRSQYICILLIWKLVFPSNCDLNCCKVNFLMTRFSCFPMSCTEIKTLHLKNINCLIDWLIDWFVFFGLPDCCCIFQEGVE